MSTLSYPAFPPVFFAYFRSRKAASDPFSGFVLMERDSSDTTNVLVKPADKESEQMKNFYNKVGFTIQTPLDTKATYMGMFPIKGDLESSETDLYAIVRKIAIHITLSGGSTPVPVLEIPTLTKKFVGILKRNVPIKEASTPGTTVEHIPPTETKVATTPLKKKKEIPPIVVKPIKKVMPVGDLQPFVAKQLLELAQLKKEMCPITAEEYIIGETAVMPCGHLFMTIAITESFKKELHRCPACRQSGRPTYV